MDVIWRPDTEPNGVARPASIAAPASTPPSISALRQQLQVPLRNFNDVGGILFGDWLSIYVSWCFIRLGIGPNVASYMMLVLGLGGAVLLPFGGLASVLGVLLIVGYYIADCVDGEVARYRGCESFRWSLHDLMFGTYVQTAFYLGLGAYAALLNGESMLLLLGVAAAVAKLFSKLLGMAPSFLTTKDGFLRRPSDRARLRAELASVMMSARPVPPVKRRRDVLRRYGLPFGLLRAVVMNFDLSLLALLVVAVLDLWLPPAQAFGLVVDGKMAFLLFYAAACPLNFAYELHGATVGNGFQTAARRLLEAIDAQR